MVEQAKYTLLRTLGEVEVRAYTACVMAKTELPLDDRNLAFRQVASYIFGGNKEKKQIAMTAPVVMSHKIKTFTMAFIMPEEYSKQSLPAPISAAVKLESVPARTIAALRFSGFTSEQKTDEQIARLLAILAAEKIRVKGAPFVLGYNAPWTLPFLRRNEVAVEI